MSASYEDEKSQAPPEAILTPLAEGSFDAGPLDAGPFIEGGGPFAEPFGSPYAAGCDDACWAGPGCDDPACHPPIRWYQWAPWVWGRAEYLLWWTDGMDVPPLVTSSPVGTPLTEAGVLGEPDTSVLFGGSGLNDSARSGGRFTLGLWLDSARCNGLEATYLFLGDESTRFDAASTGDPHLARPFFNVTTGLEDSQVIAFEELVGDVLSDVREGSVYVDATTRFSGLDVLFRRILSERTPNRLDLLLGYQQNTLSDTLGIGQSFTAEAGDLLVPVGTTVDVFDQFDTTNRFHGVQLGVAFRECVNRWSLDLEMKLGLGNTHSKATVRGQTTIGVPGAAVDQSLGGLLALASNIGVHERDHFGVIPQLGATLGYRICPNMRATVGYTFLYWSQVARPGHQLDPSVNTTLFGNDGADLAGTPRPAFSWSPTDFLAQGLHLGLDCRY